jgi:tRNA threonylcarbamoyladenosine biosynthesis protein TsaB
MKLLAIDTATPASSVALFDGRDLVAQALRVDRRGHVGFLVTALEFCFGQAGWEPADLDAVVVDVGPGLFTGIRAGIATAQGVAAAIGAPIVPISSLDALAYRAATGRRRIWAVVDARKGQVATAPYRPVPGGVVKDGAAELVGPDEFRAILNTDPRDILLVGDWQSMPDRTLRGLHRVRTGRPRYPTADVLLDVAAGRAERGEFVASDALRPLYMREPDATIGWSEFRREGLWPDPE